ncbi:NAD-dependent epimerase/dehydratase family protein [Kineobactrum salinum]|uniref:NAD-dependent epimerase/dehydratase family protein n=1 Tax=Kineobactrum salinum TaxID=2708301 RepID=A0A6C0U2S6_9GAMM|nr:NAD-dependent epimerase/dehydratase family protein [Kineobactrum salinum]QIB64665.1 NAD-dependent epimerase/dehydratase family protein [Kineobactrum salinum]
MKALVTGATGFIGRELCRQLTLREDTVLPLSCRGEPLADGRATTAVDLRQALPEPSLLSGVDVVYHLAGIAHQRAAPAAYTELNERATLALAAAAEAAGVSCFVFLSSVKAMGAGSGSAPRAEQDAVPPEDPYGRSKWEAECGLRRRFARSAMRVVILRPALVYGPEPKGNLRLLLWAARLGLPGPPIAGGRSMVGVADLAALMSCLPEQVDAGVHSWIVTDGQSYTTAQLYQLLRAALGRPGPGRQAPLWCWRLLARILDGVSRQPAGSSFDKLFATELYCNAALLAATRWRPQQSLATVAGELAGPRGRAG